MKLFLFVSLAMFSLGAAPGPVLENTVQFFYKENLSLPVPANPCAPVKIQIPVSVPQRANAITRIYSQNFSCQEMITKLSVYHHSQNGSEYYSQQVSIYVGTQLLSMCSGYFAINQTFLIPGACAGALGQKLFGFSILK